MGGWKIYWWIEIPRWAAAFKRWGRRYHDWFSILYTIWLWISLFCSWLHHVGPLHLSGFPALAVSTTENQITVISRRPCLDLANELFRHSHRSSFLSRNAHSLVLKSWLWLASPIHVPYILIVGLHVHINSCLHLFCLFFSWCFYVYMQPFWVMADLAQSLSQMPNLESDPSDTYALGLIT